MSEPVKDELGELVALLRSVTPREETLDAARAGVLRHAPVPSPLGGIVVRIALATIAALVVGSEARHILAPMHRETPRSVPQSAPPEPIVAAVAEPPMETVIEEPPAPVRPRVRRRARSIAAPAPPPMRTGPSPELAQALSDYSAGRYAKAAVAFAQVVEGSTDDGALQHAHAQFFLAKCLYQLGLYHSSAAAFDEIARAGEQHPYFGASLPSLAALADRIPEDETVVESLDRYRAEQLSELDVSGTRELYHRVLYSLGRARYEDRRFADAVSLLHRVPDGTRWARAARLYEGMSHVELRRARPALASFRRVVDAPPTERIDRREADRLRDIAWLSIARLYYSFAMEPSRSDAQASELLTRAMQAWQRIPRRSEYWTDAFFEETWALYAARQYARALGHVHGLDSPHLRDRADPEAAVIRAMIFYEHCQWDATERALARFHRRYDPIYEDARTAERMAGGNESAFRMLVAVRVGRARVPRRGRAMVRAALGDRELGRRIAQVASIDREQHRLASFSQIADSSLGTRIEGDLAIARSLAIERAGRMTTQRLHRLTSELSERMTQMDTIEAELARQRRTELGRPNRNPMGPPDGGTIWAVQGEQLWPFSGEWWPDEIPHFMQDVRNRCR